MPCSERKWKPNNYGLSGFHPHVSFLLCYLLSYLFIKFWTDLQFQFSCFVSLGLLLWLPTEITNIFRLIFITCWCYIFSMPSLHKSMVFTLKNCICYLIALERILYKILLNAAVRPVILTPFLEIGVVSIFLPFNIDQYLLL